MFKYKYSKLYWFLRNFEWMKVYFSPFKPPIPKLYYGKVVVGCPYFFPRVFRKATPKRAIEEALKEIKRVKVHNEKETIYKLNVKTFSELYEQKLNSSFSQPKKVGFNFVSLGYKTKWSEFDFRHEYNPIWSFVFFKWQIAITFVAEDCSHFWECWLYYTFATDKTKTIKERLEQAKKEFPCVWRSYTENEEIITCYWDKILKSKYL